MSEPTLQEFIKQSFARVRAPDGVIVGSGFLVSRTHVLTCAHVVDHATGDNGEVTLDFPFVANGNSLSAWVVSRKPHGRLTDFPPKDGMDIALLQLKTGGPSGSRPARLVRQRDLWKRRFRTFGFPAGRDDGVWVEGEVKDVQTRGWAELDKINTNYFVVPGFSGGPVWDEQVNGVVGMIVAADRQSSGQAAFMLPTDLLLAASPILAASEAGRQVEARHSCLLIKPRVTSSDRRDQQEEDIDTVIMPAVKEAGMTLHPEYPKGLAVNDILADLVPKVYEAEIVVVDANCYSAGEFTVSPHLYYFLGMRHAKGNETILVSRSDTHLPHSFQHRPHTLVYDPSRPRSVRDFITAFTQVVQRIQARAERRPDNPIQEYWEELARKEELQRAKAEQAEAIARAEALRQQAAVQSRPTAVTPETSPPPPQTLPKPEKKNKLEFRPVRKDGPPADPSGSGK